MTAVSKWKQVLEQVFQVTHRDILPLVGPVVCHSSPEGYLPPDEDGESQTKG